MAGSKNDKTQEVSAQQQAFAKHAEQDDALRQSDGHGGSASSDASSSSMTVHGRFMVFLIFPVTCGVIGLYLGHLESTRKPERKISFDQDFVMPFLLALAMAVVLFFQTGGFTSDKVKPIVAWPKVRRVKKVVRKTKAQAEADKEDYASNKKDD